jgi:hypothetical protein
MRRATGIPFEPERSNSALASIPLRLPEEIPADEFERVARVAEAEGLANRLLLDERRRRLT